MSFSHLQECFSSLACRKQCYLQEVFVSSPHLREEKYFLRFFMNCILSGCGHEHVSFTSIDIDISSEQHKCFKVIAFLRETWKIFIYHRQMGKSCPAQKFPEKQSNSHCTHTKICYAKEHGKELQLPTDHSRRKWCNGSGVKAMGPEEVVLEKDLLPSKAIKMWLSSLIFSELN